MLIRRVIVENYGLYAGRHEFDLLPREKYRRTRPIILFGGMNGAGKTTLLDAVRLALYGRIALGPRIRQIDYDSFLRARIHRSRGADSPAVSASVAIEFDYVQLGELKTYRVERSWRSPRSKAVEESFTLYENGNQVRDTDVEVAEAFAREIVPEGLSQLFFFDGEKIRELAEDDKGNEVLAHSIKALLGLDVVERLSTDLSIYVSRKASELADGDELARLKLIDEEIDQLRAQKVGLAEQLDEAENGIDAIEREIVQAEEELRREGHVFSKDRDKRKAREAVLIAEIARKEAELRSHCERFFPLALCPGVGRRLRDQMARETDVERLSHLGKELRSISKELVLRLRKLKKTKPFKSKLAATAATRLSNEVEKYFNTRCAQTRKSTRTYLQLSDVDAQAVAEVLDQAELHSAPEVQKLCAGLEKDFRELERIKLDLKRVPGNDVTGPIVQRLHRCHERLGALQHQKTQLNEQIDAVQFKIQDSERRRRRAEENIQNQDQVGRQLSQTTRVRAALDDYLQQLTARKIEDLRRAVAECFNRLARKGDVIRNIDIDHQTFEVTLYDHTGTAIPKAELSSGEKQIYAIAMLWALARTSGRPLPMIIDTPLARLDSDHRRNLCQNYFPHAAHQVIIMSTDTEVDQELFKELSPNVSHCFHLNYDKEAGCTSADEGYFWREVVSV